MIFYGDCLEVMKTIEDNSVDLILTDLPYGVTQAEHDIKIPLDRLWKEWNRILNDRGTVILFGQGLFTAELMTSSETWRYNLVWDKVLTTGFLNASRQPLRRHEDICVFYGREHTYNPQMTEGVKNHANGSGGKYANRNYGKFAHKKNKTDGMKYPTSVLTFRKPHPSVAMHPTEKPVELLRYLIKTYSNEGDTVLDCCMGSGSTGVACKDTNRAFIGIEKDKEYYDIAKKRIDEHYVQLSFV